MTHFFDYWLTISHQDNELTIEKKNGNTHTVPYSHVEPLADPTNRVSVREMGRKLFDLCFPSDVLRTAIYPPDRQSRLLLSLGDAQLLKNLCWESLSDSTGFLALAEIGGILRYQRAAPRPLHIENPRINILVTQCYPSNKAQSDYQQEVLFLRHLGTRSAGLIHVDVLNQPSLPQILRALVDAEDESNPYHIWHYLGAASQNAPGLVINNLSVPASQINQHLSKLNHLKLVVLNARYPVQDTVSERPLWNIHAPVAVHAMHPIIGSVTWAHFVHEFYTHVFKIGINAAVRKGRQVAQQLGDGGWERIIIEVQTLEDRLVLPPEEKDAPVVIVDSFPIIRDQVFISYSRHDQEYFKKLKTHLRPFERSGEIIVWDDTHIPAGSRWFDEIKAALRRTKVAVLLVSPHFMASDFVAREELPDILAAESQHGLMIIWFPVSAVTLRGSAIKQFQAAYTPLDPLDLLDEGQQNRHFARIVELIVKLSNEA